jgi:hypothetical protein
MQRLHVVSDLPGVKDDYVEIPATLHAIVPSD